MSKFAIIQINHNQYLVEEGKQYEVPKFTDEIGKFEPGVLAIGNDSSLTTIGDNKKAKVVLNIDTQEKGEKVRTMVYRAKARYRKTHGFRKQVNKFTVVSID